MESKDLTILEARVLVSALTRERKLLDIASEWQVSHALLYKYQTLNTLAEKGLIQITGLEKKAVKIKTNLEKYFEWLKNYVKEQFINYQIDEETFQNAFKSFAEVVQDKDFEEFFVLDEEDIKELKENEIAGNVLASLPFVIHQFILHVAEEYQFQKSQNPNLTVKEFLEKYFLLSPTILNFLRSTFSREQRVITSIILRKAQKLKEKHIEKLSKYENSNILAPIFDEAYDFLQKYLLSRRAFLKKRK